MDLLWYNQSFKSDTTVGVVVSAQSIDIGLQ